MNKHVKDSWGPDEEAVMRREPMRRPCSFLLRRFSAPPFRQPLPGGAATLVADKILNIASLTGQIIAVNECIFLNNYG